MVIPWVGYSLSALIKRVEPQGSARYVEFVTLADAKQMPGLRSPACSTGLTPRRCAWTRRCTR